MPSLSLSGVAGDPGRFDSTSFPMENKAKYKAMYLENQENYTYQTAQYYLEKYPNEKPPMEAFDVWTKEKGAELTQLYPDISKKKLEKNKAKYKAMYLENQENYTYQTAQYYLEKYPNEKPPMEAFDVWTKEKGAELTQLYPDISKKKLEKNKAKYKAMYLENQENYTYQTAQYYLEKYPNEKPPMEAFDVWTKEKGAELTQLYPDISKKKLEKNKAKYKAMYLENQENYTYQTAQYYLEKYPNEKPPMEAFDVWTKEKGAELTQLYPDISKKKLEKNKAKYKAMYLENQENYTYQTAQYYLEKYPNEKPPMEAFDVWTKEKGAELTQLYPDISKKKLERKLQKYWRRLEDRKQ
ncbi:nucleolar transcription factor 1-like [Montipora foliosa]|uniref:nucleolar transcription factor 1-like n=1 Tax=Montipora foliosa TaxID=591990 RepID=UPI0035F17169